MLCVCVCVCFAPRLKVLALMTLLMISVESDLSHEEWKSLSNPQTRTLVSQTAQFFMQTLLLILKISKCGCYM